MKKLFLFSLLSFFFIPKMEAQNIANGNSEYSFIEWNFGFAYIEKDFVFPGTSVLFGKTYIDENNLIFEYEVGFALPSLVTGKLGIGKMFTTTKVIAGVRPFPFNFFLQSSFAKEKKGYWIASIEFNPLDSNTSLSFNSKGIMNFGYRWNLSKKSN